jgi:hypothetical protein
MLCASVAELGGGGGGERKPTGAGGLVSFLGTWSLSTWRCRVGVGPRPADSWLSAHRARALAGTLPTVSSTAGPVLQPRSHVGGGSSKGDSGPGTAEPHKASEPGDLCPSVWGTPEGRNPPGGHPASNKATRRRKASQAFGALVVSGTPEPRQLQPVCRQPDDWRGLKLAEAARPEARPCSPLPLPDRPPRAPTRP